MQRGDLHPFILNNPQVVECCSKSPCNFLWTIFIRKIGNIDHAKSVVIDLDKNKLNIVHDVDTSIRQFIPRQKKKSWRGDRWHF